MENAASKDSSLREKVEKAWDQFSDSVADDFKKLHKLVAGSPDFAKNMKEKAAKASEIFAGEASKLRQELNQSETQKHEDLVTKGIGVAIDSSKATQNAFNANIEGHALLGSAAASASHNDDSNQKSAGTRPFIDLHNGTKRQLIGVYQTLADKTKETPLGPATVTGTFIDKSKNIHYFEFSSDPAVPGNAFFQEVNADGDPIEKKLRSGSRENVEQNINGKLGIGELEGHAQLEPTNMGVPGLTTQTSIADRSHPGNPLFEQVQASLDKYHTANQIEVSGEHNDNMAAALALEAASKGLTRIDGVSPGGNQGEKLFAVQGNPGDVHSKVINVNTVESMNTPLAQSTQAFDQLHQQNSQGQAQEQMLQPQRQQTTMRA